MPPRTRRTTDAPAPSPNRMAVERSCEVGDGGELLRADHQHGAALPRRDEPFGDREGVQVAGAGGADVERRRVVGAEQRLEVAGGGRQQPVGARGGEHDAVEVLGGDARRAPARSRSPRGSASATRLLRRGDAALADAGALDDPLVGGVEHLRRDRGWSAPAAGTAVPTLASSAKGRGIMPAPPSARCANSAPMCWLSPACAACTATRIAFLIALGLEAPWQTIETPLHAEQRRAAVGGVVENAVEVGHLGPARTRRGSAP